MATRLKYWGPICLNNLTSYLERRATCRCDDHSSLLIWHRGTNMNQKLVSTSCRIRVQRGSMCPLHVNWPYAFVCTLLFGSIHPLTTCVPFLETQSYASRYTVSYNPKQNSLSMSVNIIECEANYLFVTTSGGTIIWHLICHGWWKNHCISFVRLKRRFWHSWSQNPSLPPSVSSWNTWHSPGLV